MAEPLKVEHRGSMKNLYLSSSPEKTPLSDLKQRQHLYALGPLDGLKGEILIWDSVPLQSRIQNGTIQTKESWDESASFLVWSSVPKWRKIKVPPAVTSVDVLESWLGSMSKNQPPNYPFLLKGKFARLNWHLVNAESDGKIMTPDKHRKAKVFSQTENAHPEILGFWYPSAQGVFIPQGRRTHLHFRLGKKLVAHLDDFLLNDEGASLYVPDLRQ